MFSALKKLAKGGDERCPAPVPMSSSLQKKFSRGVHFNMKILIKGDRNVGKSCLLQRLQGGAFIEQYTPTEQIQVAPIHWAYKNTDYIVKVEVWEVVDKGQSRKKTPLGLKLENQASVATEDDDTPVLDASFLDVHKNAHGVILMMDITKPWTFEYVVKELSRVPPDLPVVVLGNHCDMMHHRQVHPHHIDTALQDARASRSASVRYAESSMRNGFGLRFLHKFLSVPFLRLQRQSLIQQLQRNESEAQAADSELDLYQSSEEADYTTFTERLANKRRESGSGQSDAPQVGKSIVLGGGKPIVPPHVNPLLTQSLAPKPQSTLERDRDSRQPQKDKDRQSSYVSPELLKPKPEVSMDVTPTKGGVDSTPVSPNSGGGGAGGVLDDFYAGTLDTNFLDDLSPLPAPHGDQSDTDSDDGNVNNPMVTLEEDDLDMENFETTKSNAKTQLAAGKKTDYKTSPSNYKNLTSEYKKLNVNYNTPTSDYKNFMSDYTSSTGDYKSSTSDYKSSTNDYKNSTMSGDSVLVDRMSKSSLKTEDMNLLPNDLDVDYLWTADSSARRSPEGGEDPDLLPKETEEKSEKKHKKKKSKDKEDKYKERGDGDTVKKEKKHKQKRSKEKEKKSPQQDLLSPSMTFYGDDYDSI